jgi:WD40 repeat protein
VAFTPDATAIATSVVDDRVIFWDTRTGSQGATLSTPYPPIGLAYVSGGTRLVTTRPLVDPIGTVGRVDVWDTASLQPVGDPVSVPGGANLVDTDRPGGQRFVTGSNLGNETLVWDVDPAHWELTACRIVGRNLTAAEWRQYLPGRSYQVTCPTWPAGG